MSVISMWLVSLMIFQYGNGVVICYTLLGGFHHTNGMYQILSGSGRPERMEYEACSKTSRISGTCPSSRENCSSK